MLWKVTLPSALPWIARQNIGLTYALVGVIVAEILASNRGASSYVISSRRLRSFATRRRYSPGW